MPRTEPSEEQRSWELTVPIAISSDTIWGLDAYRSCMFLLECVQRDLNACKTRESTRDQLIRAAGDAAAALAEGYSRATKADRVRFYGYTLGSIRECVVWYSGLRDVLPEPVLAQRLTLTARCRALTLGMINSDRTAQPPQKTRHRFEP